MKKNVEILKQNLKRSPLKLDWSCRFIFQHDHDPKPMSLLVKNYLQKTKVSGIKWPAHCPDMKKGGTHVE